MLGICLPAGQNNGLRVDNTSSWNDIKCMDIRSDAGNHEIKGP
jgi:hypothetical protein